jgi:hypothetical protein
MARSFRGILGLCLLASVLSGCAKQEQSTAPQQAEAYRQKHIQRTERMQQEMSQKK